MPAPPRRRGLSSTPVSRPRHEDITTDATDDARGRRTSVTLGNGVNVDATFDADSHHLARLFTHRSVLKATRREGHSPFHPNAAWRSDS